MPSRTRATSMFNAVAIVSALHLLSEASVPACNDGAGLVRFERLPDTVTEPTSVKFDAIRKKVTPVEVLGLCVDRCLEDETVLGFKTVCTAFDHHPGKRINSYNNAISFTETKCFLTRPQDQFIDVTYRNEKDSVHYRKVCYTASVVRAECPARLYAMERLRNKRFLPKDSLKVAASTIEECQDKCLRQYADDRESTNRTCRSGTFDKVNRVCHHSAYTIRTHPHLLEEHHDYDYFENTCLTMDRRCPKNKLMFLKAVNTELWGPHDTEVHRGVELDECKELCIDSVSIFCRSFEYDTATKVCTLSDEDTISKPSQVRSSSSNSHQYYQVICIDGEHVRANYIFHDSADTQQLNQRRYSDVRTAFQLFRDSRLELGSGFRGYHEVPGRLTLAECLDECLEERTFTCRSVMHSEHSQVCRLSEYDQLNGRLAPDGEYNYFENLLGSDFGSSGGSSVGGSRPRPHSGSDGTASSRCYASDDFEPVGTRLRLRSQYVRDYESANTLSECKRACLSERSYTCRSFNYRYASYRDNCELSDESTHTILRLNNPSNFETDGNTDYYERGGEGRGADCHEVSQLCTEDGMEFTLRTDEPFRGRIYTYGYYDRCFIRGSGSSVTNLRITGPRGSPDCGTTKYGDTTTNIVVVQFADNVQTSLDKRYNLTCTVVGPGEAVVTSGYIGAGSGAPTPIEYLPAENQLQSKVRLQILYGGRPTTTIAVGDPLTFKLESQRGFNLVSDIFATDVIAKDPYSGRTVELIDSRGCPVDNYVFPALGKGRDGDGLEARFNAFKIPEASFLIFEATVRTCRRGCEPARCTLGNGREDTPSYGRRRRDAGDAPDTPEDDAEDEDEDEGQVHGIYEVYLSREEIDDPSMSRSLVQEVCLAPVEYYSLVAGLVITVVCLVSALLAVAFCFRRHRQLDEKNATADAGNPYHQPQHLQPKNKFSFPGSHARTLTQPASYFPSSEPTASAPQGEDGAATSSRFPDPSEPIYTDPALFERSMSELPARRRYADGEE